MMGGPGAAVTPAPEVWRVVIAANFTAEPIRDVLSHWLRVLKMETASMTFAPYNQIVQQLIDPTSALSGDAHGINVLLVRPEVETAPADADSHAGLSARRAAAIDQLVQAIDARARTSEASWIVASCPPAPPVPPRTAEARAWSMWEQRLEAGLAATPGTRVIRASNVLRPYGLEAYYDEPGHRLGDVPYTRPFFAALATSVARAVHGLVTPPRKVIVLDCDHTLWSGTCGEDGLADLVIDAPRHYLQEFVLDRMRAGALLCVCSRNEAADVWRVFDGHAGMRLRREHLAAWRIDWQDKSHNLRALAEELQLDLDTFILVDDDPVVCAEVQARLPQVVTVQLPAEADRIPRLLDHVWAFDLPPPTEADRGRTAQYRLRGERERSRAEAATPEAFERALDVRVHIRPAEPPELARIAQLTTRTTQFNCTLQRRSESELRRRLTREDEAVLAVHASDRHGDYGLVGAIAGHACGAALIVDTFLLSCRALGRNIERHMIREVARLADARGHAEVRLPFVPGIRNAVARAFLDGCAPGWRREPGENGPVVYVRELRPSARVAVRAAGAEAEGAD